MKVVSGNSEEEVAEERLELKGHKEESAGSEIQACLSRGSKAHIWQVDGTDEFSIMGRTQIEIT